MKAWLRLALAVFILAGLVTVPTSADGGLVTPMTRQTGGGSFDLQCAQFCMVALCASPEVCGVHVDANGQRACGCHNPYGEVGLLAGLGLFGSTNAAPAPPEPVYCCGLSGGCQLTPADQCRGTKWSSLSACASNCL